MSSFSQQPISLRTYNSGAGDLEIIRMARQAEEGNFHRLREYLSRTRASGDWQDRIYILERIAPKVSIDALDAACAAEPEAADLFVTRCAYYAELAKTMRGNGTADTVSGAHFQNSADCVKAALSDMSRSTEIDDQDPTAYTLVLKPLTIFSQVDLQRGIFAKATAIAPDLVPAHFALVSALSKRWGGSHEASLSFARNAMTTAPPGSDMAACLFWAHTLVRTHFLHFDDDLRSARRYASEPGVASELNAALDTWLVPSFFVHRSSIPFLVKASEWYRDVKDEERLNRVIAFTGEMSPATSPKRGNCSSKFGGGMLGWIFGGRR